MKNALQICGAFLALFAERTRFELVVRYNPYAGLANRWFQPLTHLSRSSLLVSKREGKVTTKTLFCNTISR